MNTLEAPHFEAPHHGAPKPPSLEADSDIADFDSKTPRGDTDDFWTERSDKAAQAYNREAAERLGMLNQTPDFDEASEETPPQPPGVLDELDGFTNDRPPTYRELLDAVNLDSAGRPEREPDFVPEDSALVGPAGFDSNIDEELFVPQVSAHALTETDSVTFEDPTAALDSFTDRETSSELDSFNNQRSKVAAGAGLVVVGAELADLF